jgi:hypothetical protein
MPQMINPKNSAVVGVGSKATAAPLTAMTPKPIRMLKASAAVVRAAN